MGFAIWMPEKEYHGMEQSSGYVSNLLGFGSYGVGTGVPKKRSRCGQVHP